MVNAFARLTEQLSYGKNVDLVAVLARLGQRNGVGYDNSLQWRLSDALNRLA